MYESETCESAEWEPIKETTNLEVLTSEVAGLTILDGKKYVHGLDEIVSKERLKAIDLNEEAEKNEEEMARVVASHDVHLIDLQ